MEVRLGGRWSFLALATVAFALSFVPTSASAANPACPSTLNSFLEIDFPDTVVIDRKVNGSINLNPNPPSTSWTANKEAAITLGLQDEEPFFEGTWTIQPYSSSFYNYLTWLNKTYEFSVTATFKRGNEACDLKKVKTIRTIRGKNLYIKLQKNVWFLNNGAYLYFRCPRGPSSQISAQPIKFVMTDWTTYKTLSVRNDCEGSTTAKGRNARGPTWSAYADTLLNYLKLRFKERRNPFSMRVKAVQGGRVLTELVFRVKWVSRPARRIYWTQADAYWNYCINKGRPIKSENGQLYCWTKDRSENRVRVIRKS